MTPMCDNPIGSLVLGGHVQGLGIIRSLGKKGVPVCLLDKVPMCIARFSRYCRRFFYCPNMDYETKFCERLISLALKEHITGWVLFPTDDSQVAILSRNKQKLQQVFRIPTPGWEVTKLAYNKRLTYRLAKDCGIPIPQTFFPKDLTDALEIAEVIGYPVIIKPAIMHKLYSVFRIKLIKVSNSEQLRRAYKKICQVIDPSEIMIQEIIPGPPKNIYSFCSFFKKGEVIASFSNRHLRQIPMDFGKVATIVETVKNDLIEQYSVKLLKRMGYYGISEVEFKFDERDGKPKFLEINPRTWKQVALGDLLGLPFIQYKDLIDGEVEFAKCNRDPGVKWIDILTDLPVVTGEIFNRRITFRTFMESWSGKRVFSTFSTEDPNPFFAALLLSPLFYFTR